jgi:hypothetical protein
VDVELPLADGFPVDNAEEVVVALSVFFGGSGVELCDVGMVVLTPDDDDECV